ncbi:hypothetical protein NUW58_g581 [Xylaria curta]|uniref:Uncharacterized protein n=1 Tax=Xylaria curta TaxID=42375 RepID=A0ACC1PPX1_9PEZI|nr:hypothetical protein NUW58_g581 [Xylaria curta]
MSASPDGRDQRALHPHRPRASSRADEPSNGRVDGILNGEFAATVRERDEGGHNDIVPAQDEQTNGGYNVADGNGADPDVKNAAPRLARSHQIDHQNIHQNTPANNRNVPAPDPAQRLSPASLARALEQHASSNQVNGVAHADGELNKVNSTAASGSTDGSSRSHSNSRSPPRSPPPPPPPLPPLTVSQRSDSLAGANSQHPRGPGVSASQASDAGDRARQAEAPRSSSHNPGPTSNQGSQVDTGGETRSGEVYELDSSRNKSNQNTVTPEYNQVLVAPQGNNSHNQQISRDISFDGASDMVDEAVTSYLNTSQDGFHTQSRDPSGGLGRFTHLDTTDSTPQQSHLPDPPGPSAQASSSRPSLNPIAPSFVPRPEQPGVSQTFTLPPWQPDADVTNCPICHVQFGLFLRKHHCR